MGREGSGLLLPVRGLCRERRAKKISPTHCNRVLYDRPSPCLTPPLLNFVPRPRAGLAGHKRNVHLLQKGNLTPSSELRRWPGNPRSKGGSKTGPLIHANIKHRNPSVQRAERRVELKVTVPSTPVRNSPSTFTEFLFSLFTQNLKYERVTFYLGSI